MANTYGLSSVEFGVPTITGMVTQSYDLSKKPAVVAEVVDENGIRKHVRYDDITSELSLECVFNGGTIPTVGGVITYDATKYEVTDVTEKGSNKGFLTLNIKCKNSTGITLP